MINNLKVSLRYLFKNRFYLIINVFGLAIGFSAFLVLGEYVHFERNYDAHLSNVDNLYRMTTDQIIDGEVVVRDAMSFYPSGQAIKSELPEVIDYTTTFKFEPLVLRKSNDALKEEHGVVAVDRYFLKLFDYQVLYGDTSKLAEPNQLILTRSKALEYFSKEDAVGESLLIHSEFEKLFNVSAVIEDLPASTHYKFDVLMSISTIQKRVESASWTNYSYYTYLKVADGASIERHKKLLANLAKKYIGPNTNLNFNLQPLRDIHLSSGFTFEPEISGNAQAVKILSIIGWVLLFAAFINYTNLATANALNRAKEIGLRKVIGARRSQLAVQFFTEAFILNFIAALLAFLFIHLFADNFNALVGKAILIDLWSDSRLVVQLFVLQFAGTVLSGIYPSMLLSGFNPLGALKGTYKMSPSGLLLRKGLVAFQFAAALIFIATTLVVAQQVSHMRNIDKGMNTEQVVGLRLPPLPVASWEEALYRLESFSQLLKQHPGVLATAVITNLPGGGSADINTSGGVRISGMTSYNEGTFYSLGIDEHVLPLLAFELLHGRNFIKGSAADAGRVIVNEAFFRKLRLPAEEKMIGKKITFGRKEANPSYEIIGIIKDANRTTSKYEVEPTVYFSDWGYGGGHGYGNMMVKLIKEDSGSTLDQIQKSWTAVFPNEVFNYQFLDHRFEKLYEEDRRFGNLIATFCILVIFISVLGLFGLMAFLANQRIKEVGVRKVLGASSNSIIWLFYTDIFRLLGYAILFGTPIIWWSMNEWLSQYSSRIDFPWWVLVLAMVILLLLSFLTILIQTRRVAEMNPTEALRCD